MRKKCPYSELFWFVFSRIRTECGEILRTDQNNSEYGYFSRRRLRLSHFEKILFTESETGWSSSWANFWRTFFGEDKLISEYSLSLSRLLKPLLLLDLSLKLRRKRSCEIKKLFSPIASSAHSFYLQTQSIIISQRFILDPVKHLRWSILWK